MGRGQLFALPPDFLGRLAAAERERQTAPAGSFDPVMDVLANIEETWDENRRLDLGKGWPVLHACLSDGTCEPDGGAYPLNRCILGGRHLFDPDGGCMAALVTAVEVRDVAAALMSLDADWLACRLVAVFGGRWEARDFEAVREECGPLLESLTGFYRRAAALGWGVLLTTDEDLSNLRD
jgi:hypothetical protein